MDFARFAPFLVAAFVVGWLLSRRFEERFEDPTIVNWNSRAATILHHLDADMRSCAMLRRIINAAELQIAANGANGGCVVDYDEVLAAAGLSALPEFTKRDLKVTLASVFGDACALRSVGQLYADCQGVMKYAS